MSRFRDPRRHTIHGAPGYRADSCQDPGAGRSHPRTPLTDSHHKRKRQHARSSANGHIKKLAMEFSSMKLPPFMRRWRWVELLALLVFALALVGLRTYLHSPSRGLPYRDSFANAKADEWKAFGGTWELVNGLMHNGSDERGAKLLTGSTYWRNYYVEADVNLLGTNGEAGLIIRSRDEEEGVNGYTGYYAGVRTIDSTLVLGRAEHGWMEVNKQAQDPEGIRAGKWYHLKLLAYDCHIVATAAALPQSA